MVGAGEHVRAGQPLLYVSSPDYSMLRSAYMKARDSFQLADRVYKRDQDLLAHKAIAQADLDQAESARAQAEADLQSSEQALRVLGITDPRSEEHTSELQSHLNLVCRLLLEKKKDNYDILKSTELDVIDVRVDPHLTRRPPAS